MRIVETLREGPRSVGELAKLLEMKQPQVSKHLRVLSEARIVTVQTQGNRRIYSLLPAPFITLDQWIGSFSRTMHERFDNLEEYLERLQAEGTPNEE